MAIGNAPWPMGVTMVGIHERSAREKIFTNQVHINIINTHLNLITSPFICGCLLLEKGEFLI